MADDGDFILLTDEAVEPPAASSLPPWKVAVIDDDAAVHDGTRFALQDYRLAGRGLDLLMARSSAEGRALLAAHSDMAVVLLDVVMESDVAGLELVDFIRHELGNDLVRIILRTGQPGQAPEQRIVVDYDINDYKAKTELTADKLFTTLTAAIRSYEQLLKLTETRRGLETVIEVASRLYDLNSLPALARGVLAELAGLIGPGCSGLLALREKDAGEQIAVLAGCGHYEAMVGAGTPVDPALRETLLAAFDRRGHDFAPGRALLFLATGGGREIVVLLDTPGELSETERSVIEVLCSRLAAAFDNVTLYEALQEANIHLEDRVRARTADLASANAFKNEVLGTIAHDLKNPLGVILGRTEMLTDLLAMQPPRLAEAAAQVGHIRDSARRLTGMVDSLIADAVADAVNISVRPARFALADLVAETVEANRLKAEEKGQTIEIARLDAATMNGDADRIREAVDNLLSNAIKYAPQGGRIAVALRQEGDVAVLSVEDSGPGLSPEDMDRLFGRFQRLSAKPTGGERSTGLGLSIAKRIVELHGGAIVASSDSTLGGAVFTLRLPAGGGAA